MRLRGLPALTGAALTASLVALLLIVWLAGSMPRWAPGVDMAGDPGDSLPPWLAEVGPPVPEQGQTPARLFAAARDHAGPASSAPETALCKGKVTQPDEDFRRFRKSVIVNTPGALCSLPERVLARAPLAVLFGSFLGALATLVALAAVVASWGWMMFWLAGQLRRWWLYDRPVKP